MKRNLLILIFLVFSCSSNAQVVARVQVDTTIALIGKQVKIKVQLSQPKSVNIDWSETDSLDRLEILAKSKVDTLKTTDPEILLRSQIYTVTAYDSGIYNVPAFNFKYTISGNPQEQIAQTDPLQITYFLVPVDTTKAIKDIKPIAEVPYDWTYVIWISIGSLILLIIGYFIYRYIQKKRALAKLPRAVKEIVRPAHEIALEELEILEAEKIWQQGNLKLYHTTISDILRQYIFLRWNINAMEMTSDEILHHGFINILKSDQQELLGYVLRLADYVKFAKAQPISHENEQSMRSAVQFVESSIPKPVVNINEPMNKEVLS